MIQPKLCKECRRKGITLEPEPSSQPQLRQTDEPHKCANPDCEKYVFEAEL